MTFESVDRPRNWHSALEKGFENDVSPCFYCDMTIICFFTAPRVQRRIVLFAHLMVDIWMKISKPSCIKCIHVSERVEIDSQMNMFMLIM